jgi:IS605 OrfB family transposase
VKVKKHPRRADAATAEALGIDLGLKDFATDSNGEKVEAPRFCRDLEPALAVAQRAGNEKRVRALHAKISNRRKDFLHKLATAQAQSASAIFVGDVAASALTRTGMSKSVLDAGWASYRTMLQYKCEDAGVWFAQVDEGCPTQDGHVCGTRAGPKGRAQLAVRRWTCPTCGTDHDRDVNAARNIRARGLGWLEGQFAEAAEARADEPASNEVQPARAAPRPGMAVL